MYLCTVSPYQELGKVARSIYAISCFIVCVCVCVVGNLGEFIARQRKEKQTIKEEVGQK